MVERTCPGCGVTVQAKTARGRAPRCSDCVGSCKYEGCERPKRALGWCITHYTRVWAHGDVETVHKGGPLARTCIVDDCDDPNNAYGLCRTHHYRVKKLGVLEIQIATGKPCGVSGCPDTVTPKGARGICTAHYKRLMKHGDVRR